MSTTSPSRRRTRAVVAAFVTALVAALLLLPGARESGAAAIPPGGAGPDTPGTASSIATKKVPVGGTVKFTVQGFPGGETLYIKIDDEAFCTSPPFGACVYHQQKIPANGTVNGSMTLPAGLPAGSHTLRFLASQTVTENGQEVLKGYTRKSPAFTVEAASAEKADKGGAATSGAAPAEAGGDTTGQAPAAEPSSAGALVVTAPSGAAVTTTEEAAPPAAEPVLVATPTTSATDDDLVPMPWIGLYVLLGCLLVSSLMTTIAVFRRR
ncbi:hypothetical protein [Nocardioides humi]|uniref:CopC domain-containing protein n=1 Tax=Nocardioides humi TaxID=449461 RepID=A0ABN2AV81_9ACTN|nr:hypothetical protein [Nocardioides humi]